MSGWRKAEGKAEAKAKGRAEAKAKGRAEAVVVVVVPGLADFAVILVRLEEERKEVTLEFRAEVCHLERPEALDVLECQTVAIIYSVSLVGAHLMNSHLTCINVYYGTVHILRKPNFGHF